MMTPRLFGAWYMEVCSLRRPSDPYRPIAYRGKFVGRGNSRHLNDLPNPHTVSGNNISNVILGKFEYRGEKRFSVGSLVTTQVGQPSWADQFLEALAGEVEFRRNTTRLQIFYDAGRKSVTLLKQ